MKFVDSWTVHDVHWLTKNCLISQTLRLLFAQCMNSSRNSKICPITREKKRNRKTQTQTQTQTPDPNVAQVLQKNLQYYYNAILKVELQCSSIVKYIYFILLSQKFLSPLSHYLCSVLSLPSLFLICYLLSSDPNTILLPTSTSHITVVHFLWWVAIRQLLWVFLLLLLLLWPMLKGRGGYG